MKNTRYSRNRWMGALTVPALVAALVLSGCGVSAPDEVVTPTAPSVGAEAVDEARDQAEQPEADGQEVEDAAGQETADDDATAGALTVTPQDAAEIALDAHPGSRVVSIELERNHGLTVWEVEVVTADAKFEVEVDTASGKVVTDERDHTSDLAKYNRQADAATVTYGEAIEIVLGLHPGATLVELELDDGHGGVVWEIDLVTPERVKYEVELDAATGKVLENKIDD